MDINVIEEMIWLYKQHRKRCEKLLEEEQKPPFNGIPQQATSDNLALLNQILAKLADQIKAPQRTSEEKKKDILGLA